MAIPQQVGRHQIREPIGSGSFATVWRGYDADLDADVAVKVLADNWVSRPDVRSRFIEEARLLRRADSDRIVRVHDIGALDDGRPYFVMTYADGGTVADRLREPLTVPEALGLAAECARGIAVLHELGVLHRDIKPSNILFRTTVSGKRAVIADLGLAKALAGASGDTVAGGTPGYMAPEQFRTGGLDKRADVYALGALTYQLLTSQPPNSSAEAVPPPSALRAGIHAGIDRVVKRALARDPEWRWADAGAFASAVEGLLRADGQPREPAQPVPAAPPPHAPVRHMPPSRPAVVPVPVLVGHGPRPVPQRPTAAAAKPARDPRRRRRRIRRWVTAVLIVCFLCTLPTLAETGLNYFGNRMGTLRASHGQVTARVPNYWFWLNDRTERQIRLKDFGGSGKGLQVKLGLSPDGLFGDYGIAVVAGRSLDGHPARQVFARNTPNQRWLPANCKRPDTETAVDNPAFRRATLRTWTKGRCGDGGEKYGQAVLRGRGYAVHVYMVGGTDEKPFTDVVESLRVDKSALPA